jgi:ADP-ribosylglycohydrolase
LSINVGAITHADPRCTVSCCIEVSLVRALIRGDISDERDVDACIERSYRYVRKFPAFINPGDENLTEDVMERRLNRKKFDHVRTCRHVGPWALLTRSSCW